MSVKLFIVIIGLILAYVSGMLIQKHKNEQHIAGTLRLDHSDPEEAPYLFLELEKGGLDIIRNNQNVTFKVAIKEYIS